MELSENVISSEICQHCCMYCLAFGIANENSDVSNLFPSQSNYILYLYWKMLILSLEIKCIFQFVSIFSIILPNICEAFWIGIHMILKLGEISFGYLFCFAFVFVFIFWLILRLLDCFLAFLFHEYGVSLLYFHVSSFLL